MPPKTIYELRIYHVAAGCIEKLHRRFENITLELFKRHGIQVFDFWTSVPIDSDSPHQLVYMLVYKNQEVHQQNWAAFIADPEWIAAREKSEEDGLIVDKIEVITLVRTSYSPAMPVTI